MNSKFEIRDRGKNTGNGPFSSKVQAENHIKKMRGFAEAKIASGNDSYRSSLSIIDALEIVEIPGVESETPPVI